MRACVVLVFSMAAAMVAAEETEGVRYVTLQPAFVTNYGVTETGRLKYLKADVTLKVANPELEVALKYHAPALRNALVLLFSRQEEATVSTSEGREQIRVAALTELRAIMQAEDGEPIIDDLVFSNFVVQR